MTESTKKPTLREQRRSRRSSKLLRQRLLIGGVIFLIIAGVAALIYFRVKADKEAVIEAAAPTQAFQETLADVNMFVEDLVVGDGPPVEAGDYIAVHYVGTLADGTVFDSSRERDKAFEFTLGAGEVISGWDQGLIGMNVGGIRRLVIPPELAYGPAGVPPTIPANATLTFEVELIDIIYGQR